MKQNLRVAVAAILTFIIGFIISVQISTTQGDDYGSLVPLAKLKGYEAQLNEATKEKEDALDRLHELEEKMANIEADKANESDAIRTMVEENEKNKMMAGLLDVYGPGIVVEIKDPPSEVGAGGDGFSLIAFNYEYLLSFVNKLKEAGAEAISINGERIIQTTEISLAGENININGKATAGPYTINAIGNGDTIESAITIRAGIVSKMQKAGLTVNIRQEDKVEIPRYNGVIAFDYATPAKEKD